MIPIIIICFNNYKYVDNTIKQLLKVDPTLKSFLIIMDNASNDPLTCDYLKITDIRVIFNTINNGPWITSTQNSHVYNEMPNKFIITDPDFKFNTKLPTNFVEIMLNLSEKYNTSKIGFAISLENRKQMYPGIYHGKTIYEHELQFWQNKINDPKYKLYSALLDTTFCLINKTLLQDNLSGNHIRIAGDFTAVHLPFYIENPILTKDEEYAMYQYSKYSTMAPLFFDYFHTHFTPFLISKIENDQSTSIQNEEYQYESPTNKIYLGKYKNREPQYENKCIKIGYYIYIFEHGVIGTGSEDNITILQKLYVIPTDPEREFDPNDTVSNYALYRTTKPPFKLGKYITTEPEWKAYYQFEINKGITNDQLNYIKKVSDEEWEQL